MCFSCIPCWEFGFPNSHVHSRPLLSTYHDHTCPPTLSIHIFPSPPTMSIYDAHSCPSMSTHVQLPCPSMSNTKPAKTKQGQANGHVWTGLALLRLVFGHRPKPQCKLLGFSKPNVPTNNTQNTHFCQKIRCWWDCWWARWFSETPNFADWFGPMSKD